MMAKENICSLVGAESDTMLDVVWMGMSELKGDVRSEGDQDGRNENLSDYIAGTRW